MENVTFITVNEVEHAIIDRGNGEYTSMTKATYEATLASELVDPALLEKPKK